MNIACRSTQNAARIKRFLRLHIVIKPLIKNKHNKSFIMWKRNSFKISLQIWRLSKVRTSWPYRCMILEIFCSSAFFSSTAESCVGLRQGVNSLATKMRVGNTQKVNGKLLHSLRFFHAVGDPLPGGGEDSAY